jgi:hypothetical protein
MKMVMTMLEARVQPDKAASPQAALKARSDQPLPGMLHSYLVQSSADPVLWRMLAVWDGSETVNQMRQSGQTPPGVLMFRAVGAEPVLSVFDVTAEGPLQG